MKALQFIVCSYLIFQAKCCRKSEMLFVSRAFTEIIDKHFNKKSITFDILTYGKETECLEGILRNILQKNHEDFAIKVIQISRDK